MLRLTSGEQQINFDMMWYNHAGLFAALSGVKPNPAHHKVNKRPREAFEQFAAEGVRYSKDTLRADILVSKQSLLHYSIGEPVNPRKFSTF